MKIKIKQNLGPQCQAQHWLKYLCNLVMNGQPRLSLAWHSLAPTYPHKQDFGPQCQINIGSKDPANILSTL